MKALNSASIRLFLFSLLMLAALPVQQADSATAAPSRSRMPARPASSPYGENQIQLDPAWYQLPRDMSSFQQGSLTPPHYQPERTMLPSVRRRWVNFFSLLRTLSFLYLFTYVLLFFPAFSFGAFSLSFYEKSYRYESILVGERQPLALWRARRRYDSVSLEDWHPLSSLPPGAQLQFPVGRQRRMVSGRIAQHHEFWEPENMRQFRLYVLAESNEAETYCMLVYPKVLGDWRRVIVRTGIMHPPFAVEDAPITWPPQDEITLLGEQGWPATYVLAATNWEKRGINTVAVDLSGISRHASDPPGRQYQPRAGAFWSYRQSSRKTEHRSRRHLDIFLLLNEAVMLETDLVPARQVSFDLRPDGQIIPLIRHK